MKFTERSTLAAESPIVADNSPVVAVESPIVTTESPIVTTESPIVTDQRPQKRKRCVTNWKKNVIRRLRNTGSEYVKHGGTLQKAKKLNEHYLINHSCKNKCAENLTLEQTKTLFENFWKLGDFDAQNLFLAGCVKQSTVERRRPRVRKNKITKIEKKHAKDFARVYSVFADNKPVTVCKPYFLAIFDISSGRLKSTNGRMVVRQAKMDEENMITRHNAFMRNTSLALKIIFACFPHTKVTILEVTVHLAAFYLLI